MLYNSFTSLQEAIKTGQTTCENQVDLYLKNIEDKSDLNAFVEVYSEEAKEMAKAIDAKIKAGNAGRLAGMVVGVKDNICYAGHKVTASSKILEGFESLYSATAVQRLIDEDAIIIGRLSCDEFAMGSSNEKSVYGSVKNPHDTSRVPGGSSGASAVAVAANLCMTSLGSDTGGSIRQPASFCGVVGYKPTYSRISRHGLLAYGSSFDQIGPFTHTVDDAALMTEVMAGKDEFDATSSSKEVEDYSDLSSEGLKRIAYIKETVESDALSAEIKATFNAKLDALRAEGHTVEAVDFPLLDALVPAYYVLTTAEASSNLSRYDGVHYGYRSPNATDLESTYKLSRTEGFGEEVKRRIMLGTFVLSAGYYDAYYGKAMKVRRLIQERTNDILSNYDFILTPTTPDVAFKFGANNDDPTKMYLEDIFTVQANLAGVPAISVPLSKNSEGLPFAMQLMGRSFEERDLMAFSKQLMEG
jgi:aspartyl-tRNA(Asn)/glutamyl-tRNA(Gln) amidotransferase subunit A